ncbi:DUF6719 family protein [Bradyrhizobium oligotrophicum]|uniref:DUF6719 family protein n=1 Tax=Bradyrhizobium oligotrophicum TaxID=44255 RepID=UPI003EB7EE46
MRSQTSSFAAVATRHFSVLGVLLLAAAPAHAQYVGREQDVTDLRLGQRVLVDDGTCPAGQVKEVSGSRMADTGIVRTTKCVARFGPKKR